MTLRLWRAEARSTCEVPTGERVVRLATGAYGLDCLGTDARRGPTKLIFPRSKRQHRLAIHASDSCTMRAVLFLAARDDLQHIVG
jgi:hypothetical protein